MISRGIQCKMEQLQMKLKAVKGGLGHAHAMCLLRGGVVSYILSRNPHPSTL